MEEKQTIEQAFEEIEQTIEKLQSPDTSLEQSFALYEQGMKQIAFCNKEIDGIEKKIRILSEE
ncbi:MAG: exodeoxyribonuclease VII small subunit [Lachnospiraceae bacterium]